MSPVAPSGSSAASPVLVGLPARNEADTVAPVAEAASLGLLGAFPDRRSAVVLADNCSTDGTKEAFLGARVGVAREVRETAPGEAGKGRAVRLILEEARERDAEALVLLDADLAGARPEWIGLLAGPVLEGFDLVTPLYARNARDGAVTKHFACPVVAGLAGLEVRQPIGGEFALSRAFVRRLLERPWPAAALGYGVDIMMTLEAARGGLPTAKVSLGAKIHRSSSPRLERIFLEVAEAALDMISEAGAEFAGGEVREFRGCRAGVVPPVAADAGRLLSRSREAWRELVSRGEVLFSRGTRSHLAEAFEGNQGRIDEPLWHACLSEATGASRKGIPAGSAAAGLLPPFLGRAARFWEETDGLSPEEVEGLVAGGVRRFAAAFGRKSNLNSRRAAS